MYNMPVIWTKVDRCGRAQRRWVRLNNLFKFFYNSAGIECFAVNALQTVIPIKGEFDRIGELFAIKSLR